MRPHDLQIGTTPAGPDDVTGQVSRITRIGFEIRIDVTTAAGQSVIVTLTRNEFLALGLEVGTTVHLRISPGSPTTPVAPAPAGVSHDLASTSL